MIRAEDLRKVTCARKARKSNVGTCSKVSEPVEVVLERYVKENTVEVLQQKLRSGKDMLQSQSQKDDY